MQTADTNNPKIESNTSPKNRTDDVNEKLNDIYGLLIEQSKLIQNLTEEIKRLNKTCSKMDGHIDFVEATYETIKHPLSTALKAIKFTK